MNNWWNLRNKFHHLKGESQLYFQILNQFFQKILTIVHKNIHYFINFPQHFLNILGQVVQIWLKLTQD